jgi:hypothetical protein
MNTNLFHRLCLLAAALLAFSSCKSISPEKRATVKRVVIGSALTDKIDRYYLGITAFGNEQERHASLPGLKARLEQVLMKEFRQRYPQVSLVNLPDGASPEAGRAALAGQTADLKIVLRPFEFYAATVPAYMQAMGLGTWQGRGDKGTIGTYFALITYDGQTGEVIGQGGKFGGSEQMGPLPKWQPKLASLSPAERETLISTLVSRFRNYLQDTIQAQGL